MHIHTPPVGSSTLAHLADIAKTLGNPQRLVLLEHMAQGELAVEQLAEMAQLSIANTSQHLQTLKRAGLVSARRQGKHMLYQLGNGPLAEVLAAMRNYAEFQRHALHQTLSQDFQPQQLEAITMAELQRRMREQAITLIDVRPEAEFAAAHIPGALNIPLTSLQAQIQQLPQQGIVAYCRDPYCISSTHAVELLLTHGLQAQRLIGGVPEWAKTGMPVAHGQEKAPQEGL